MLLLACRLTLSCQAELNAQRDEFGRESSQVHIQHAAETSELKLQHAEALALQLKAATAAQSTALAAVAAKHAKAILDLQQLLSAQRQELKEELDRKAEQHLQATKDAQDLREKQAKLQEQHRVLTAAHEAALQTSAKQSQAWQIEQKELSAGHRYLA